MWRVVTLVVWQIAASAAGALDCYSCGGLNWDKMGGSCEEFREALSWSLFWVTCPDQQFCVKMTSLYPGEQRREFRGCADRESSFGLRHALACRRANISDSYTEFCFCDTRFCNAAVAPAGVARWLLAAAGAAILAAR